MIPKPYLHAELELIVTALVEGVQLPQISKWWNYAKELGKFC